MIRFSSSFSSMIPLRVVARPDGLHLVAVETEAEEVLFPRLFPDLDVRPVEGPDREGAVEHELHVARAGCLVACGRYLLGELRGGDDVLGQGHAVIRHKDHLELLPHKGMGGDHVGHVMDQLDHELAQQISRRGFAGEEDRPRDE